MQGGNNLMEITAQVALTPDTNPDLNFVPHADKRYELLASSGFLQALFDLAQDEGMSTSDIIRRSVGLYSIARNIEAKGGRLACVTDDGQGRHQIEQIIKL
jgi:hypothetical protein